MRGTHSALLLPGSDRFSRKASCSTWVQQPSSDLPAHLRVSGTDMLYAATRWSRRGGSRLGMVLPYGPTLRHAESGTDIGYAATRKEQESSSSNVSNTARMTGTLRLSSYASAMRCLALLLASHRTTRCNARH
eukprot:1512173-Rhodomonas_salina.2